MAKRLLPLLDRVLVEKIEPPVKSVGGVLLPEIATKVSSIAADRVDAPGKPPFDRRLARHRHHACMHACQADCRQASRCIYTLSCLAWGTSLRPSWFWILPIQLRHSRIVQHPSSVARCRLPHTPHARHTFRSLSMPATSMSRPSSEAIPLRSHTLVRDARGCHARAGEGGQGRGRRAGPKSGQRRADRAGCEGGRSRAHA